MSDAISLGTAYVEILPSAKNVNVSFTNILNPVAESAGKSAGALTATNMVNALKQVLTAADIGKVFQMFFGQGAELQQSLNGTEAVFGEFSKKIQTDAAEAFRNMGISQSEYMTAANEMGNLLQGSGLDQQKSLEITSSAMQRAADVASSMGIDTAMAMEGIAEAAKGNYTMMENLGVAMNETTLQAYALEKGVNFEWDTASNAEKAELAMEMFMDSTSQHAGNFARESEQTLSGSLNSMKSIFNDFLGNLALGRDIGPSLQALATTTISFLMNNLIPMILNVVKSLPDVLKTVVNECALLFQPVGEDMMTYLSTGLMVGIPNLLNSMLVGIENLKTMMIAQMPALLDKGGEIITNIANGIMAAIPSLLNSMTVGLENLKAMMIAQMPTLLDKGVEIVSNIANGILVSLPSIVESVGPLLTSFITTIGESKLIILQAGADLIMNLVQGLIDNGPAILVSIGETMAEMLFGIASSLPEIYQKGIEIIGELIAGLISSIPGLLAKIPGIVSQVSSEFLSYDWLSIGTDIICGIRDGLLNSVQMIIDAITQVVNSAWDSVLDFFGINSPSRKGIYVGEMIDLGLAKGIKSKLGVVKSSMNELAELSTGTIESDLSLRAMSNSTSLNSEGNHLNMSPSLNGFNQTNNIYSPVPLSPAETARQIRNSTRQLGLSMRGNV